MIQLLHNFIRNSGLFLSSKVLALAFIFITPWLQDGCSHLQISLSYSRPEGAVNMPAFYEESKAFPEFCLADLCLHFIVTWALPAGLEPGKARDSTITIRLDEGLVNFFCNRPDSKYFRLCSPYSLCCNHSILPF